MYTEIYYQIYFFQSLHVLTRQVSIYINHGYIYFLHYFQQ